MRLGDPVDKRPGCRVRGEARTYVFLPGDVTVAFERIDDFFFIDSGSTGLVAVVGVPLGVLKA